MSSSMNVSVAGVRRYCVGLSGLLIRYTGLASQCAMSAVHPCVCVIPLTLSNSLYRPKTVSGTSARLAYSSGCLLLSGTDTSVWNSKCQTLIDGYADTRSSTQYLLELYAHTGSETVTPGKGRAPEPDVFSLGKYSNAGSLKLFR